MAPPHSGAVSRLSYSTCLETLGQAPRLRSAAAIAAKKQSGRRLPENRNSRVSQLLGISDGMGWDDLEVRELNTGSAYFGR